MINISIRIEASALLHEGQIIPGVRHDRIFKKAPTFGEYRSAEQGFITSDGEFVTREHGVIIAYIAGQIPDIKKMLFSEDLW